MHSFLLALLIALSLVFAAETAHAQTEIIIPFGASDPNAPFFWSEKSTGITTGNITINSGDSITWYNEDTAFHTVTSVTAQSFQTDEFVVDGVFDSGFFTAGKSYTQKFTEPGNYYYFCTLHPFMKGVVYVLDDLKSIDRVGSEFTESGFEVKYILDTNIRTVSINPDENTITFTISDTANEQITLILPSQLIENPNAVWVDDTITDFKIDKTDSESKLVIPISPLTKEITVMGTHVIPEFGFFAIGILSVGLVTSLLLIRSRLFSF